MIIVKLQGGLANQIFQWAYGKTLSEKYHIPVYLDISSYIKQESAQTKRYFSLNKFPNLKYQTTSDIVSTDKELLIINEGSVFERLDYKSNKNYYLHGYWQDEKYFLEFSDIIRQNLAPPIDFLKKLQYPIESKTVSLHIRRTDYLSSSGYHPVQTVEYYKEALNIIKNYDYVFIFSDDIAWCKNNLNFNNMVFIENLDDVENIWLMSLCENNIIANSSFSWWGAWLNENPNKRIIAPKQWFGDASQNNLMLNSLPNAWIKI